MSEHQHIRADGTVMFLPHRLNRHPVVVRGLTADELWICCGLSGAAGLLVQYYVGDDIYVVCKTDEHVELQLVVHDKRRWPSRLWHARARW